MSTAPGACATRVSSARSSRSEPLASSPLVNPALFAVWKESTDARFIWFIGVVEVVPTLLRLLGPSCIQLEPLRWLMAVPGRLEVSD